MERVPPGSSSEESSEEHGWLDRRFVELRTAGRSDDAYRLLLAHLGGLRDSLRACYLPELGGAQVVEELAHETASKAVAEWATYVPARGGVRFWALRIGQNLVRDRLKEQRARRERERHAARNGVSPCENGKASELREAIAALPAPYGRVLACDLEHGGRAPAKELAELFGVELQTIYDWRCKAIEMLSARLR